MDDPHCRACLRFGWSAIAFFLLLGLALESLHLIKAPFYFEVRIRRELWTLAHAHGALLGVVNVIFGLCAARLVTAERWRHRASVALRAGGLLVPVGFLLGGIGNTETDPSLFILVVPVGALLALAAVVTVAVGAWEKQRATPPDDGRGAPDRGSDQREKPGGSKRRRR